MIVYVKVTKKTIKSLINLRSQISKVSGYIVNIKSSIVFFCIVNKMSLAHKSYLYYQLKRTRDAFRGIYAK